MAIDPDALRAARAKRGLSQSQAAEGIVSSQALSAWERGQTRPERAHLEQLCARLGIPVRSVLAAIRDLREAELARLEARQAFAELRRLATEVVDDVNVRPTSQNVARYYLGRALVTESPRAALAELRRARAGLAQRGLHALAAEALDWQAVALYYLEDPAALAIAGRALEAYRKLPDHEPTVMSRMHEHLGAIQLQRGQSEEAIVSYRRALDGVVDIGRAGLIYHGLAIGHHRRGQTREALDYMERAVNLFRARDEARGQVAADCSTPRAENTCAYYLLRAGDLQRAEAMATAALEHFAAAGVEGGQANAMLTLGEVRQHQGQVVEALDWTARAIELAEHLGVVATISSGYQQLGELWAIQGEQERCEAAFSRAIELLAELPERRVEALARYRRLTARPASHQHA